jgi:uncharacterized protein (DUF433 family)
VAGISGENPAIEYRLVRVRECEPVDIIAARRLLVLEVEMTSTSERITINPEQCGGRPCIRGMRIRVIDILDLYAAGLSAEEILDEMPDLEIEDLKAALQYAARRLDHPVIAA